MHLVDTSVWIQTLRRPGAPAIQAALRPLILAGQVMITELIILELMCGIRKTERADTLLRRFEALERPGFSDGQWHEAWILAAKLRKAGVTPTATDCLIATMAIAHHATLVHCDTDFEAIAEHSPLQTLNWTQLVKSKTS
ncbi:MAG TPA: PIN domain-containing protein [Terriglobia bacterium]|jgi:hypothetical protein